MKLIADWEQNLSPDSVILRSTNPFSKCLKLSHSKSRLKMLQVLSGQLETFKTCSVSLNSTLRLKSSPSKSWKAFMRNSNKLFTQNNKRNLFSLVEAGKPTKRHSTADFRHCVREPTKHIVRKENFFALCTLRSGGSHNKCFSPIEDALFGLL